MKVLLLVAVMALAACAGGMTDADAGKCHHAATGCAYPN